MRVVYFVCVLFFVVGALAEWRPQGTAESQTDQDLFDDVFKSLLTQYGSDVLESKAVVVHDFCDTYVRMKNINDLALSSQQIRLDALRKELDKAVLNPTKKENDLRQSVFDALRSEYGQDVVDKKSTLAQEYVDTYIEMQKLARYESRSNHRRRLDALRFKLSK